MNIEPPVCVALDVPGLEAAKDVVRDLSPQIRLFKVGLELFCSAGPSAVTSVRDMGAEVLLDLKIHDIPRTAAAAIREASRLGAAFVTIHGLGGRDMIRAAVETAREHGGPRVLVVSVLTSMDDQTLSEVGIPGTPRGQALRVAELAAEESAYGLVLSPWELHVVRPAVPHLLLATPGVRPSGSSADDHRRILSPAEAILAGADLIVVGRPVLESRDKRAAAAAVVDEVREAAGQHERRRSREMGASISDTEDAVLEEDT